MYKQTLPANTSHKNYVITLCKDILRSGNIVIGNKRNRVYINKMYRCYLYEHGLSSNRRYYPIYRIKMEIKLGRFLKSTEIVHHKNGNTFDDRTCNLILLTNRKEHYAYHKKQMINGRYHRKR